MSEAPLENPHLFMELGRIKTLIEGLGTRLDNHERRTIEDDRMASENRAKVYEKIEGIGQRQLKFESLAETLTHKVEANSTEFKSWRESIDERLKRLEDNDIEHARKLDDHHERITEVEPEAEMVRTWRQRGIGMGIIVIAGGILLGGAASNIVKDIWSFLKSL
ncbi:hypothetical protein Q669_29525 [Labrenzia sp. C1B10]|uniref:hypothetical protein n=1 Tax=unclassified Labrenzia TaxID=2648686 RepID=UPI0003B83CD2|nr:MULTISPECIES: hypothetical protein [unclassified Labrenzia]ERP95711.1 hypothetical protein Q669_29525 [Labrenzia sp. C1B10]ERS05777.1 hypothetical protein Q675_29090 [Labrenzia sp. C1B70]